MVHFVYMLRISDYSGFHGHSYKQDKYGNNIWRRGDYYLKHKFWKSNFYYTGETWNPAKRLFEHLHKINSTFLKENTENPSIQMVYLEKVENEEIALKREKQIKRLGTKAKEELIKSELNIFQFAKEPNTENARLIVKNEQGYQDFIYFKEGLVHLV